MRDVALPDGDVDLGTVVLTRGHDLRVRVLVPAGEEVPEISVRAFAIGSPSYRRATRQRGRSEIVLSGLAPGELRVFVATDGHAQVEHRVQVEEGLEVVYDLR